MNPLSVKSVKSQRSNFGHVLSTHTEACRRQNLIAKLTENSNQIKSNYCVYQYAFSTHRACAMLWKRALIDALPCKKSKLVRDCGTGKWRCRVVLRAVPVFPTDFGLIWYLLMTVWHNGKILAFVSLTRAHGWLYVYCKSGNIREFFSFREFWEEDKFANLVISRKLSL